MAAEFRIEHDRQWTVLVITRPRGGGREPRVRHVYFTADELAEVTALLAAQLPPVTVTRPQRKQAAKPDECSFARLRRDSFRGWVLTCDMCQLDEAYWAIRPADQSLAAHIKMHETEMREADATETEAEATESTVPSP